MTVLKWFLLCVFGFILAITGSILFLCSFYSDHYPSNCTCIDTDPQYSSCLDDCSGDFLRLRAVPFAVGMVAMSLGFLIVLCSSPVVICKLRKRPDRGINTESANWREQLNAQSDQLRIVTERLSQMEKQQLSSRETEYRPLGCE